MLFYYIRHGDPIYDPDSLTPLGHLQAEALAKRLCLYGMDQVYVSSSVRARMTAEPTCKLLKLTPTTLDWANESYAWRDLAPEDENGRCAWAFHQDRYRRLFNDPSVIALGREWYTHKAFAGTAFASGLQRIQTETDALMESLGYRHDLSHNLYLPIAPTQKRVALFAHQGFGLAFLSCLLDIPYPQLVTHFDMGHSAMTVIDFALYGKGKDAFVLPRTLQLSNDSHIYREGLPTKYQNLLYF